MPRRPPIRNAQASDIPELVRLENAAFPHDQFSRRRIGHLVKQASGQVLVMAQRRRLIAAAYLLWRKPYRTARLYNISVDPEVQGQGLGAYLLRACERRAKARGCLRMSLEVRTDNRGAIRLYQTHGYCIVDELPDYYEDEMSALRMVKPLGKVPRA